MAIFKIFRLLGIIFTTTLLAVGLLYALRGNIYLVAGITAFVGLASVFLVLLLEKKKTEEDGRTQEIIWGSLYGVLAIGSFIFFFHGISIEFLRKDAIKKAAYDKLEKVEELFRNYNAESQNRLISFKTKVETSLDAYLINRNPQRIPDVEQLVGKGTINFNQNTTAIKNQTAKAIEAKQKVMRSGYELGTEVIEDWNNYKSRSLSTIDSWNRFNLNFAYYDIDSKYKKIYELTIAKMPDFKYADSPEGKDIALDKPFSAMAQSSGSAILLSTALFLVLQLLTLLPYLSTQRPKRKLIGPKNTGNKSYEGEIY